MSADPPDDVLVLLQEAGADRRALGATLLSIQNREGHSALRTFGYECGHTTCTALLSPPKDCPACRQMHYAYLDGLEIKRRMLNLHRRQAAERAEKAHTYGKPHLICELCVVSRSADAKALAAICAGMFSPRRIRGFRE